MNPQLFWQFSCDTYAREEVKILCLHCQNKLGLNVNLLLLCAWLTKFDGSLSVADWQRLQEVIAQSELELAELREQRRQLEKGRPRYKAHMQQELELEARQQSAIITALGQLEYRKTSDNPLCSYFSAANCHDKQCLQRLLALFSISK